MPERREPEAGRMLNNDFRLRLECPHCAIVTERTVGYLKVHPVWNCDGCGKWIHCDEDRVAALCPSGADAELWSDRAMNDGPEGAGHERR